MTKLYKLEIYVLDINGDSPTKESVLASLTRIRHPEFLYVEGIQEAEMGSWHDDHELNKRGCDYSKYFKKEESNG